jgi:hypothetical protein
MVAHAGTATDLVQFVSLGQLKVHKIHRRWPTRPRRSAGPGRRGSAGAAGLDRGPTGRRRAVLGCQGRYASVTLAANKVAHIS